MTNHIVELTEDEVVLLHAALLIFKSDLENSVEAIEAQAIGAKQINNIEMLDDTNEAREQIAKVQETFLGLIKKLPDLEE